MYSTLKNKCSILSEEAVQKSNSYICGRKRYMPVIERVIIIIVHLPSTFPVNAALAALLLNLADT